MGRHRLPRTFKDQTAAQHAWVALFAFGAGIYGLTGAFMGIGVLAAIILLGTVLQSLLPPDTPWIFGFYLDAGILLLMWFAWTGVALRQST